MICAWFQSALRGAGPYVVCRSAIAACTHERRDWKQIAVLYRRLEDGHDRRAGEINRAIALAELKGPAAALALLDELDLERYQYLHSTRADLLHRLGRHDEARAAYTRALCASADRAREALPQLTAAPTPARSRVRRVVGEGRPGAVDLAAAVRLSYNRRAADRKGDPGAPPARLVGCISLTLWAPGPKPLAPTPDRAAGADPGTRLQPARRIPRCRWPAATLPLRGRATVLR
jgi:tetratricopeptide (TPR) repeat protein